jgi:hypothetical protein
MSRSRRCVPDAIPSGGRDSLRFRPCVRTDRPGELSNAADVDAGRLRERLQVNLTPGTFRSIYFT